MPDIVALLQCLQPFVTAPTLQHMSKIVVAMLAMSGRVTMLGLSRWAGPGGAYRTVQRFFYTVLPWALLLWTFFRQQLHQPGESYLLAGDEVVVSKAGKHTYGLDHFFASLQSRVIPSVAFFSLALVSIERRCSFPVRIEQIVRSEAEKAAASERTQRAKKAKQPAQPGPQAVARRKPGRPKGSRNKVKREADPVAQAAPTTGERRKPGRPKGSRNQVKPASPKTAQAVPPTGERRKPGRPKGSRNQVKTEAELSPELQRIQAMLSALLTLIAGYLPLTYLVLDGHFGNHLALQMVRQCGLQLISKLRCDAALYQLYAGPYQGRGRSRKYGAKLDYAHLPDSCLKETTCEGQIETRIYQLRCLHHDFSQPLNVVIIAKRNRHTHAHAQVILFASDLELAYDTLIDYYRLRFQIEFNFRDAKQYWGLEDFMNITPTAISNAANLSLFMVNLSHRVLAELRASDPDCSVLDLKALYRGAKYVAEAINILPQKPEPVLLTRMLTKLATLGRIHRTQPMPASP